MSTKTKIMAFVSLASLTMVLLMVGVWALKTVNFTVGGNLSYIAPGIEATISKGTMSNGIWVNAGDASTKMPLTQITRTDTEESIEEKFSYWQDLNLTFNETGDDVTITFSITNDMEKYSLVIGVTTSCDNADNATIGVNLSSVTLQPSQSQQFTITLAVTEKKENASLPAFAIVFHMEMGEALPIADDDYFLSFSYSGTNATVTGLNDDTVTEVVIPQQVIHDGTLYDVTAIDMESFADSSITSVHIPSCITRVGDSAFSGCENLTSVTIEEGVTSIEFNAFYGCITLAEIIIPGSVTEIGEGAFEGCGLASVTFQNGVTQIADNMFSRCTNLASVSLPNSMENIGNGAFLGCASLKNIILPDNIKSIGLSAFFRCSSLEEVIVKATTPPTLDTSAFSMCSSSLTIKVPTNSLSDYQGATNWKNANIVDGGF